MEQDRCESGLDDVAAEHDHDAPAIARGLGNRVDHMQEVACDEDVGQRAKEGVKGSIVAWRSGEFRRANLVRPAGDRDGANRSEVRFAGLY
jgi:hypothetical protein